MNLIVRFLLGLVVAAACTPAGVSGAFLLLPIQVQVLHVPSPAVSATNLLFNMVSAPAGALAYHRRGRLDQELALTLCAGTTPGVALGVLLRSTWLAEPDRFGVLAGVVLLGLGARSLVGVLRKSPGARGAVDVPPRWRLHAVGLAAGVLGGIYGLGGAALVVPWLVSVERLPVERVAGAGLVTTSVTSVVGILAFVLADLGGIGEAAAPEWVSGLALGLGGVVGAAVGVRIQPRVPVRLLRALLAIAALVAGVRMLR